jgi:hypothetical protein
MAESSEDDLLLFTPHIPARVHARGWTAVRQRAFIAALSRTGVVRAAAASVGMSARSAYQLRQRADRSAHGMVDMPLPADLVAYLGPGYVYTFSAAWDRALQLGLALQIDIARPIALEGERVPVIRRGRIIGWHNKMNLRLAIAAFGASRRQGRGMWYDNEERMAAHMLRCLQQIEATLRLGPPAWPAPAEPESREARRERNRARRAEERVYGKRVHGMLDPYRAAGTAIRTLVEQQRADLEFDRKCRHSEGAET